MKRLFLPLLPVLAFVPALLWAQDSCERAAKVQPVTKHLGDSLCFTGETHGSVGITFDIEYDEKAFRVKEESGYHRVYAEGQPLPPGGDSGWRTYWLYPKKKGKFTVYTIEGFRGEETKRTKHIIKIR